MYSEDDIARVLAAVHRKGVRLWVTAGKLHYSAPKGALSGAEIDVIQKARQRVVDCLGADRWAPFSYTQLAYWRMYQLATQPGFRTVARGIRLVGELNRDALQASLQCLVERHDALRARIGGDPDSPIQKIASSGRLELVFQDLSASAPVEATEQAKRLAEEFTATPVWVTRDALFAVQLLRVRHEEHWLILALQHLIADASSLDVLLSEWVVSYGQLVNGQPISLPPIPVQLTDHVAVQINSQQSWLDKHGKYWRDRLAECGRVRFPSSEGVSNAPVKAWDNVRVRIEKETKLRLAEWCRLHRTTVAIAMFAVYAAAVLRWCKVSEAVFQYTIGGRDRPELQSTLGYFAAALHLRVALNAQELFAAFVERVHEEYGQALEHVDYSYVESRDPRPECTRNSFFNWIPKRGPDNSQREQCPLQLDPLTLSLPKTCLRDSEPGLELQDEGDEIAGALVFPLGRLSVKDMEQFVRGLLELLHQLLANPAVRIESIGHS